MSGLILDTPSHALDAELILSLEALADRGLFLQAHARAAEFGDYRHWRGAAAMALASRLAGQLGAPRLGDALAWLGYRRYPEAAESRLRYARFLLARRGQYRAWEFLQRFADWLPEEPGLRAEWLSFQGYLRALLRDFGRSAELHDAAMQLGTTDPWLLVERSYSLEQEDRYAEALDLCERALAMLPGFRSATLQAAQFELQLGREDAARARLLDGTQRMESAGLCAQLIDLLIERGELDEAERLIERSLALALLLEKGMRGWYAGRRCDIACLRGDHERGRALALEAQSPFYTMVAERLAEPKGGRVLLPVTFIRQHHMTCVPATLTALSTYWGRPVAHLEVAEEICYDGTSYHAERAWAERNGWLVREFTVDWATSRALIDRGLPFTLSLQYTGSGHLQAVVGYDEPRGTVLIRDPGQAQFGESIAEGLYETQRASGPRGLLLLPPEEAHRLDGLELPEHATWDLYYRLVSALEVHDREAALAAFEALREHAPEHRLTLQGQRALGWYDGREAQVLEATEALLERFPDDANLILSKSTSLAQLHAREQQLDWLAGHCQGRWSDAGILVRYTGLLVEDGSQLETARQLLGRALRQAPGHAQAWNELASLRWNEGSREQACELYRIAACLHDTNEGYSSQYFRALRCLGRTEAGLEFLRQRQVRLGALAAGPTLTLCEFIEELSDPLQCRQILEQAVERRPQDPALLLNLADFYGRHGELELNEAMLRRAEPVSRRGTWLRAAVLHSQRSDGDPQRALAWCREAVELDPLNMSLHRMQVQLLRQSAGEEAVDAYVTALAERFPHHCGIAELAVERAQRHSLEDAEAALRRLLASHPEYAWAIRELAVTLARLGRHEEALEFCERARRTDPRSSSSYSTRGFVQLQAGQREAAREAFREALERSADNDYAGNMLLETCTDQAEALDSLDFIHRQLVAQVTFGDGWLAYPDQARRLLEPQVLLEQLSEALQQRPDLWQLWVVVAAQQAEMGQVEQAETLLQSAIERFPLMPRLALERAQLQSSQKQYAECRETLRGSFRINPLWTRSVRLYVESLLDEGTDLEEAESLLRSVLARTPDNTELRAYLGYVLGERDNPAEGALEAEKVLREEPGNGWVWNQLRRYSAALETPGRPLELARELTRLRAGDPDAWLALAEQEEGFEAKEPALRRALELNPRHRSANTQLAEGLLEAQRYDELRQLLAAPCWGGGTPAELALFGPRATRQEQDLPSAMAEMRQLLERQPAFFEGWRTLADWQDDAGEYAAYVESAREMVRLEPRQAIAHGFLGHALWLDGKGEEALSSFSRAYQLDACYTFAGLHEFDLLLKHGTGEATRAVLERLLEASSQPAVLIRALRFAVPRGDQALKRRVLEPLCRDHGCIDAWGEVLKILERPEQDKDLQETLDAGVADGSLHHGAALQWLRREDARWMPGSLWKGFLRLLENDPQHAGKHAMLELLANRKNANRLLVDALEACRETIRSDGVIWGMASYAMVNQDRYEMMFDWLADWEQHPEAPAWGLDNLALGMRARKLDARAAAVSRLSLERDPQNHDAMVWLGFDAAMAGDMAALDTWLERLQGAEPRPFFRCMQHLLEGVAAALHAGNSQVAVAHFRTARAVAKGSEHGSYWRLRRYLAKALAFGPATPRWLAPLRYLQLRF